MGFIIDATIKTLQKSGNLLSMLSDHQLSDNSVPPYRSSIGSHIRHILDFYDCILNYDGICVDLTKRKRDQSVENLVDSAQKYLESTIKRIKLLPVELNREITVMDDLGMGKIEIKYTLASLLSQANSHTIHHYAIINYILNGLNIEYNDENFGLNPTTPKKTPS